MTTEMKAQIRDATTRTTTVAVGMEQNATQARGNEEHNIATFSESVRIPEWRSSLGPITRPPTGTAEAICSATAAQKLFCVDCATNNFYH